MLIAASQTNLSGWLFFFIAFFFRIHIEHYNVPYLFLQSRIPGIKNRCLPLRRYFSLLTISYKSWRRAKRCFSCNYLV